MRKGGEECDDGNTEGGDGCSSSCAIEAGFTCTGAWAYWQCGGAGDSCWAGCGIGQMEEGSAKECDDGNLVAGDGCSPGCRVECGFRCFGGNLTSASVCVAAACGDKTLGGQEECDDGNVEDGDGCSSECMIEEGYSCLHYAVPPYPCGTYADVCRPVCGDGLLLGSERDEAGYCDDGNQYSGDGCSSACQEECGYTCWMDKGCETVCGDGLRAGREGWEDGNDVDGDGCSMTCSVENGWTCTTSACRTSYCSSTCGDGIRVGTEECDDGNWAGYDGCL